MDINNLKAIHKRIELNNKVEAQRKYDYRRKWKKWEKLNSCFRQITTEENKAIEDPNYLQVRRNIVLKIS